MRVVYNKVVTQFNVYATCMYNMYFRNISSNIKKYGMFWKKIAILSNYKYILYILININLRHLNSYSICFISFDKLSGELIVWEETYQSQLNHTNHD